MSAYYLTRLVQLPQDLLQLAVLLPLQVQLPQLQETEHHDTPPAPRGHTCSRARTFVFVLNHNRSFFASFKASSVVS